MALKDRISKFAAYFRGIEYQGGLLIVKVSYPDKIEPHASEDEMIKVAKSEDGLWYYYADAELVSEDAIFDMIETTVKIYEDAKQKVTLMKAKIEELRDLFANNTLEKLNTLRFEFSCDLCSNDIKPKRKYTRHVKVENTDVNEKQNNENINQIIEN